MPKNIDFKDPRSALEAVGEQIGIWRWDRSQNTIRWSGYLFGLLGLEPNDKGVRYEAFEELLHPDDRAPVQEALDNFFEGGSTYRLEIRMRHQQGHYVHLITQGYFEQADRGERNVLIGTAVDVTAEVWARKFASRQASIMKAMAENVPGAVFRYRRDPSGMPTVEFMSSRSKDIWELSPQDLHNNPGSLWGLSKDVDHAGLDASFEESARTLIPWSYEWMITTPSGETKHLQGRGIPEKQDDGSTVWNCLAIDVTEDVEARKRIAAQAQRLARFEKAEALGRLSDGIAHDFNNLLTIIMGNAELVPRLDDAAQQNMIASEIIDACRRGARLTEHLLAFAWGADLEPAVIDLRCLFSELDSLLGRVMPGNIALSFEVASDLWPLKIDEALLETAIVNLCVNSRDAMPGGGNIRVRAENARVEGSSESQERDRAAPGNYIRITVRDTGSGIPDSYIEKVAEPFFTTKAPDKGSGLGLAMVHGLVRRARGWLEINSDDERGTTVELLLPANPDGDFEEKSKSGPETIEPGSRHYTFAIVEDEDAILRALERQLSLDGHEVLGFRDGPSFLDYAGKAEKRIDFLLTDLGLPGPIQGLELALKLKKFSPLSRIIIMSGYGVRENPAFDALGEGHMVLRKPVSRQALLRCIEKLSSQR